jgi:hypothetical protein
VARQVRDEHAVPACEERCEPGEVDRRAPEPVQEEKRRPGPAEPVPRADALDLRNVRLKPSKERCPSHPEARIL